MREAIKRYVESAQSLTEVPRERAERVARRLAGSGLIERSQIRTVASDIVERSRQNRRRVAELVAGELRRQISRLGLATKADVEGLRRRLQALEVATRKRPATKRKPAVAARKPASRARRKPPSRR